MLEKKVYKQTTLNSFLKVKGNVDRFVELTGRKNRRRPSNNAKMSDKESDIFSTCSDVTLSFIGQLKLTKPKLPKSLYSEDEDDDNNQNYNSSFEVKKSPVTSTPRVGRKKKRASTPVASTSAGNSSDSNIDNDQNNTTANCSSTKVKILENTIIKSPKSAHNKSADVSIKEKKINYHDMHVMQRLLNAIDSNNNIKHLLTDNDKKYKSKFLLMDQKYQFLIMKLFTWQPIWYNIFKFSDRIGLSLPKHEIRDLYCKLQEECFVRTNCTENDDLMSLLENLDLKDLKTVSKKMNLHNVPLRNKDNIIQQLMEISTHQSTISGKKMVDVIKNHVKKEMGYCVKLSDTFRNSLYKMFLLNTFTNPKFHQPRDYFNSVGYLNVKFPEFHVNEYQIFYTESEFRSYMDAIQCQLDMEKAVEKKNSLYLYQLCTDAFNVIKSSTGLIDESRPPYLRHLSAYYKYISLISKYCDKLITQYYNDVSKWLGYFLSLEINHHKRAFWYLKLSLIYTKYLKQYESAAKLIIEALKQENHQFTDVELQELAKRGRNLHSKTFKVPQLFLDLIVDLSPLSCDREWPSRMIEKRSMPAIKSGRKRKYVEYDSDGGRQYSQVEQVAIEHYQREGYTNAVHFENNLMCALFNLFFWDIIYDHSIIGVLISKVQMWPLDLYTPYFYLNRKDAIDQRLNQISTEWTQQEFIEFVETKFNHHSHETSICNIDAFIKDTETLNEILSCIDRQLLMKIFKRMVTNFKQYSSGFPDLFVWSLSDKTCKFVEVKSQNDTLSIKQKLWLNYLIDSGGDVEVCHVHSTGAKKKVG